MTDAIPGLKRERVTVPLRGHGIYCEECGTVPELGEPLFSDERRDLTLYFCSEDCASDYLRREAVALFGDDG